MKRIIIAILAYSGLAVQASNPQLGFNELAANQAQPHITINSADRSITQAIAGTISINFASDANLTMTSSQWPYATIVFTDTAPVLSTGRDVIYPNVDSLTGGTSRLRFAVKNSTAQTLTIKRSGQTGVAVAAGAIVLLQHNGTDIEAVGSSGGSGAPTNATYITQTSNGTLSNEQALASLATGIVKNTTTTGVLSIAAQGTDYYAPGGTDVAFTDGGTGLSSASDDQTLVSSGSAWVAKTLPDCTDTGGNHLNYTQSTNAFSCGTSGGGGGGSPGGSDTQVQFNASGSFAGDADWTWDASTNLMSLGSLATPATFRGFAQSGTTGNGGGISIEAGRAGTVTGTGGSVTIKGGDAAGGGGNIILKAGDGSIDGSLTFQDGSSNARFFVNSIGVVQFNGDNGTVGNVLKSGGGVAAPSYGTVDLSNSFNVSGVLPWPNMAKGPVRTVTAAGTITVATTDQLICVNKTVAAATAVTGQASPVAGFRLTIKDCKGDALTNNITFTPASGTVDGAATATIITNYGALVLVYNGGWWVESRM